MTLLDGTHATADRVLDAARLLAPTISERAAEVEAARRLPADLLDALAGAGCFRVLLPTSHGGVGADLAGAMRVFETLARADGSVAWTVMIGACAWRDLAGLPRATFDAIFDGGGTIVAGAFNPSGTVVEDGGGYRVSGRWGFASGCEHADWLFGNCIEGVVDGVPQLRIAVFSPDEVVIEDTWDVSGLRGTGSHHFRADDVLVPAERTCLALGDEPSVDETVTRIPPPTLIPLVMASVALGIARGALDDVLLLAEAKVPLLARAPLAQNPLFQYELAVADTELRAARALLYETAESVWATAAARSPLGSEDQARVRAAAAWAADRAAGVVDAAYRAGGGSSVYADCPLQRRLRDVHALTQHVLVKRDTLRTAGAVMAGQEIDVLVF